MGVWIETKSIRRSSLVANVTPFVGVWIETSQSLPAQVSLLVTPFVGVWIETPISGRSMNC